MRSNVLVFVVYVLSSILVTNAGWFSVKEQEDSPVILWWTPFTGETGSYKTCGEYSCYFTENRTYLIDPKTQVIVFYGSNVEENDLPLPRQSEHQWALLHEESPKNNPVFCYESVISLFNFTATWSRHSSFPLTLLHLPSLEIFSDRTYYVPLSQKNLLRAQAGYAPVAYVQSSCNAPSERDILVRELSKYIAIDSYGQCLNNKSLPEHLQDPAEKMNDEEFLRLMAGYKFTLAFENAIGDDYITEKLWRPYKLGSVPVYLGSPSIRDWVPDGQSIIVASEFASVEALAAHLHALDADDEAYEAMIRFKTSGIISNRNLIDAEKDRSWGEGGESDDRENFVESFECFLCRQISQKRADERQGYSRPLAWADSTHFNCHPPVNPVTKSVDVNSWWHQLWRQARIEADVIHHFVLRNRNFSSDEFHEAVIESFH